MAHWRLLFLLAVALGTFGCLVTAVNVTVVTPPSGGKRTVSGVYVTTTTAAAAAKLGWHMELSCALDWPTVTRVQDAIDASGVIYAATEGAAGVPCSLTYIYQGARSTVLFAQCAAADTSFGSTLDALLHSPLTALPAACTTVAVVLDKVIKHATITQDATNRYNLDRTDQRLLPRSNTYTYLLQGTGVVLYHIDTGVRVTHNDFGGRASLVLNTAGDGINSDCHGHGTHTAATAAGASYGIGKNSTIISIKCLDCSGSGTTGTVIAALVEVQDRQVAQAHAAVVTISIGGGLDAALNSAVNVLVNTYNVAVVVAAGNSNDDAAHYSPASAASALTVAATDPSDTIASFSNWGNVVDIAAPGVSVLSAWNTGDSASATLSGTSMATPLVAGVVLLEMERRLLANNGTLPNAVQSMAAVKAMATQSKIPTGHNGARLPLLFSSEGLADVPQPPAPPPPPPPPPPQRSGNPLPKLGRLSDAEAPGGVALTVFMSVALLVIGLLQ